MKYVYFISYMYQLDKDMGYSNSVLQADCKVKDAESVQRIVDLLRKEKGVESLHITSLSLMHRKLF